MPEHEGTDGKPPELVVAPGAAPEAEAEEAEAPPAEAEEAEEAEAPPAAPPAFPLGAGHKGGAAPKTLFAFQYELLMAEVKFIQSRIAAYDGIAFKIKGWAVTLWSAVVGLGAKEKAPLLVMASLPVLLVFWVLDAIFKGYQRRSMTRMGVLERFFDSQPPFEHDGLRGAFARQDFGTFPLHDPVASRTKNLNEEIGQRYAGGTSFWACFWVANICWFYLILAASALIVLALLWLTAKPEFPLMPHAE